MEDVLLVKYGEIILRGKNRKLIEDMLSRAIIKNIKKAGNYWVSKEQGRFLIESREENKRFDFDTVIPLVLNVIGVTAVCPAIKLENNSIENIAEESLNYMKKYYTNEKVKFKVDTKRSDKKYSMNSMEISSYVGGYIFDNMENIAIDVKNPDVLLSIEIRNFTYIYSKTIKGYGGLPVGSSGKATLLISGGIDSAVAGFMIAKRGVTIEAVYFHSPPYTSDRAKQKVLDLCKQLALFTGGIKLYVVPFTDIQLKIYESVLPSRMTIFLKRAMINISESIACQSGSMGLVTGDSIGQVASQTMHALDAIDSAAKNLPVFRPLCGMDKQEIIDIANKIKTYEISIRPYEDCCTIFVDKHPELKPRKDIIINIEKKIEGITQLVDQALQKLEVIEF